MRGAIILAVALGACAQPPPAVPPASVDNAAPLDAGVEPDPPIVTTGRRSHLTFLVEPRDATIRIVGSDPHVGAPYEVEVDPGVYEIHVSRAGFTSHVTEVEIEAGEYQTIRIVLPPAVP